MSNKGFTLIELIVVIIIIGILAAMAIPSFNKSMENAREREARTTLELVYNAQKVYRIDKGTYAANFAAMVNYIENPNGTADYYTYSIGSATATTFEAWAIRKAGGPFKQLSIDQTGIIKDVPGEHFS